MCVSPELGNGLRYQDVEPVERLRLMGVHIVVCLLEDDRGGQARRISQDVGRKYGIRLAGSRGGRIDREGAFVCGVLISTGQCSCRGGRFRGWRIAKDEKFNECPDKYHHRQLTE